MSDKDYHIRDKAFAIYNDGRFNIKPASHDAARRWLELARRYAVRHNRRGLAKALSHFALAHPGASHANS